jgi:hypothetical protein
MASVSLLDIFLLEKNQLAIPIQSHLISLPAQFNSYHKWKLFLLPQSVFKNFIYSHKTFTID